MILLYLVALIATIVSYYFLNQIFSLLDEPDIVLSKEKQSSIGDFIGPLLLSILFSSCFVWFLVFRNAGVIYIDGRKYTDSTIMMDIWFPFIFMFFL